MRYWPHSDMQSWQDNRFVGCSGSLGSGFLEQLASAYSDFTEALRDELVPADSLTRLLAN